MQQTTNILTWLEATAARQPDAVAVAEETTRLSWAELQRRAAAVGGLLAKTAPPRRPVAFYLEKSVDAWCGMLGAVYAGCCYCVLDVRQPAVRLGRLLIVLDPAVLLYDRANADAALALDFDGPRFCLDELLQKTDDAPDTALLAERRAGALDTDPLYINFTSGSTGVPKGVAVCHRSVLDFIPQLCTLCGITASDVLANQAPFDFDVSVKDLYGSLYTGARVQLIPRSYFSNPTRLMDALADSGATTLIWAVSALCFVSVMNGFGYRVPAAVNKVLFSGEVLPIKHLNVWKKHLPHAAFVNLYGPTEITCNCTFYPLPDREFTVADTLPIGRAFPNERVFLLDENDREITESGQNGELCVAGTALALGYYRDPIRTAAAFVQNPLNTDYPERIYRTGDLARYDDAGELVYAGRKDFQIKHLGHRIELGEVEVAATACTGVSRACCVYDTARSRLHLFYTGEAAKADLNTALRAVLPPQMLPNTLHLLAELPMNKNGKLDRTALLESLQSKKPKQEDAR